MEEDEGRCCCRVRMIEYHDYKTLMGPCLISFSIPLLIPGVVLTVVGSYGNEHTFPTFGGWHISGIVILIIAVSLLLVGIVFKCFFRPYLSPDVAQHLTPRHSVVSGHLNLGFESERDAEKAKRVYKGSEQVDLNTQISSQLHRVVSTHEIREKEKVSSDTTGANGAIAQVRNEHRNYSNRHKQTGKQTNKVTHRDSLGENEKAFQQITEEDDENIAVQENAETPHKEKRRKKHRSKRSSTTTEETNQDGVTTRVTSSVRAEADTHVVTESDRERNPSSQAHEEKRRRRRKKKKKRCLEETNDDRHTPLPDNEHGRDFPNLRVRMPNSPPNVPYQDSSQYETEFNFNTPRPLEETQHIPVLFKTNPNISDSNDNENREHTRFQKRAEKCRDMPDSDEEIQDFQIRRDSNPELESFPHEVRKPAHVSHRPGMDIIDTAITQESDSLNSESDLDSRHRRRRSHKSKHSHFLKKRGIDSEQHEFQNRGEFQPRIETNICFDPLFLSEQTHNVHFQDAKESDDPYLPDVDSQKHFEGDVIDKQHSSNSHFTADYSPPRSQPPVGESDNEYVRVKRVKRDSFDHGVDAYELEPDTHLYVN